MARIGLTRVRLEQASAALGKLATEASHGERILLVRNGRAIAAIVPVEDAKHMQDAEDLRDVAEARRILDNGEPTIPLEHVIQQFGCHGLPGRTHHRRAKTARKNA